MGALHSPAWLSGAQSIALHWSHGCGLAYLSSCHASCSATATRKLMFTQKSRGPPSSRAWKTPR